jgi:hypothetical protein
VGKHSKSELTSAGNLPKQKTLLNIKETKITNVKFEGKEEPCGPDYTNLVRSTDSGTELKLNFNADVKDPQAKLLVLVEGNVPPSLLWSKVVINGKEVQTTVLGSETGWAASGLAKKDQWLFVQALLKPGKNDIAADMLISEKFTRVSAWIWSMKSGKPVKALKGLPQPEIISLGTSLLMEKTGASETSARPRPVERINGVYLDYLQPESVSQGWGILQKNQSVWEKPMTICGRQFLRGLGTHAPSKIVYDLNGKYRKFQTWAGADGATTPSVTFEIWIDGQKKWESGVMTRADQAKYVNIDVSGAKKLELVVGDGGNGVTGDHADWADTKLIR